MENTCTQSWKQRVAILGIGLFCNFLIVKGFDFVLYPAVMWYFGTVSGAIIMWVLSFAICYATIIFYDWCKMDWIGIETIKDLRDGEVTTFSRRMAKWALSKSDPVAMIIISIIWDPFICVAYLRRGANKYNGLSKRDWIIFLSSFVVSNAYWTIAVFTGLSVGEWILHAVK